jgi:hypothetical protein
MNQLTTKDALQNLQNLINAGLRAGLFSEPNAVFAVQSSLDMIKQTIEAQASPLMNGAAKQEEAAVVQ